ncbi:universal stress protein [Franzmannia qiaohouensis]|uniref:Universal stress protein n=1 Tax=Franzmannia qiaohouensis TaxID=1329370 RepID=A0ABU1HHX1_9GAMM|nr:universal stress protein [Halomonas qiaohouensis]MDR5907078.1 universal stress protein [Halomonas qiaohouensis]
MSRPISQIVVPVDGSRATLAAVRHAAQLARLWQAPLQLLHVQPLYPAELSDIPANRLDEVDYDHEVIQGSVTRAFAQARQALGSDLGVEVEEVTLREHDFVRHLAREIIDHTSEIPDSMLVMGAQGLDRLGKLLRGNLSNAVIHKARCPVCVVHDQMSIDDDEHIDRILLPVDGSSHSAAAAELAAGLAISGKLPVELMYCVPRDPDDPATPTRQRDTERRECDWIFSHAKKHLAGVESPIIEQCLIGRAPAEAILDHARQAGGKPMLIMGRRGMSQWREQLLGGVSHKVIDRSPCPITVVTR